MDRISKLAAELEDLGFLVERSEVELSGMHEPPLLIGRDSGGSQVGLHDAYGWIQVGLEIASREELDESGFRGMLEHWILGFQERYLGCRFAYDVDGAVGIVADAFPAQQNAIAMAEVIDQVLYVAECLTPMVEVILAHGREPSEEEIDAAFVDAEVH